MEDIETKVLEEIKEAWPYMSREDKMYLLGKIEGIKETVKLMSAEPAEEEKKEEES